MAEEYTILEELGRGSFGRVYKGVSRTTNEVVAMKLIHLEETDDDIAEIQSEIALLKACACPWVTAYKESFVHGTKLWIIMEYMSGGSCQDLLQLGPLSEAHVAIIMKELLFGLDFLHNEGKLHRDIKAANVLMNNEGKVKLADFGVSAQLTNLMSQRHTFVGTPFWMAPEVIKENGYNFKADIWSLGITAWELVHAKVPRSEIHQMKVLFAIVNDPAPRLTGSQYSREYKDFVHCCLHKDPDKRPTAGSLLRHKFIKNAGKTDALKPLVQKIQELNAGGRREPQLYQETLATISASKDDSDGWLFDTVKQSTIYVPPTGSTAPRRRKLSAIHGNGQIPHDTDLTEDFNQLSLNGENLSPESSPTPMITVKRSMPALRKKSSIFQLNSEDDPSLRSPQREPEKRSDSASPTRKPPSLRSPKRPIKADISFGNSPSTVRLFRRVSDKSSNSRETSPQRGLEREIPNHPLPAPPLSSSPRRSPSPSHRSNQSHNSNFSSSSTLHGSLNQQHVRNDENKRPRTAGNGSHSSNESAPGIVSKEILLGRRLYAKAIDPTLQEIHAQTSGQTKRDALAKVADAFENLNTVDPEGQLLFFKTLVEKLSSDKKLVRELGLPGPVSERSSSFSRSGSRSPSKSFIAHTPVLEPTLENIPSSPVSTPSPKKGDGPSNSPLKLVMAQNNPHLKSHKRRQSAFGPGLGITLGEHVEREREREKKEREEREREKEKLVGLPGGEVQGMEHLSNLADVLYGRWTSKLSARWPNV